MNSIAFKFNYDDYAIEMGTGNIFQTILEDYETLGVIGEEHNKLMCYFAATSRLMDNPLNILVLSSSGAGKSSTIFLFSRKILSTSNWRIFRVSKGGAFSLLEKFSGRNWNFILPQKSV